MTRGEPGDESAMNYLIGLDIGGTFTDCVIIDTAGRVVCAKAPSTPPEFHTGVIDALAAGARQLGMSVEALCKAAQVISHGTTVGTNTLIQERGARVGLLTTRGHEDSLHIMRGSRGLNGKDIRAITHFPDGIKPKPLVPKQLIEGVHERIDSFGRVVVPLNLPATEAAIDRLLDAGVESIAICFLWSFRNPAHEQAVRELVERRAGGVFTTCSAELVPKWGEYERMTAAVLNAYIGPVTSRYLREIQGRLAALGYHKPLQVTQCAGGSISVERACVAPLLTLDSGPVSGVQGSQFLAGMLGEPNVITTDMGGTSFDVGLISDGRPITVDRAWARQYEYFIPKVEIEAIGAGGGSIAWIDELAGTLHVGPDSAGARPGPVCYGRGGTQPTVTDASVVLGYLDADNFAGGSIRLDREAATKSIEALGSRLGMSVDETAAGIARIAEFKMADLIRRATVEKGLDPRDFVLFAFGGAGPMHAGVFARELDVRRVIIPQRKTASTWCAFGAASTDLLHVHERVEIMSSPFRADALNLVIRDLANAARSQFAGESDEAPRLEFSIDLRHRGQINEVEVELPDRELGEEDVPALVERFYERYDAMYGKGASFRGARLEAITFRVRASIVTPKPGLRAQSDTPAPVPADAARKPRDVYWTELGVRTSTPVYDGELLLTGNRITGPALVETTDTTVVLGPDQSMIVDRLGNFAIEFGPPANSAATSPDGASNP